MKNARFVPKHVDAIKVILIDAIWDLKTAIIAEADAWIINGRI